VPWLGPGPELGHAPAKKNTIWVLVQSSIQTMMRNPFTKAKYLGILLINLKCKIRYHFQNKVKQIVFMIDITKLSVLQNFVIYLHNKTLCTEQFRHLSTASPCYIFIKKISAYLCCNLCLLLSHHCLMPSRMTRRQKIERR
jgi:hypothetical protein